MSLRLKNQKELTNYIRKQSVLIEKALIYQLEYFVADLVNFSKSGFVAGYEDQTSNLKSSIGGVILKDGKPITYRGFENEGTATKGSQTGMEFINSKISEVGSGYVILVVAGMEYATYVENYHNLNVLKKTELRMKKKLPLEMQKLKQKISRL